MGGEHAFEGDAGIGCYRVTGLTSEVYAQSRDETPTSLPVTVVRR